MFTFSTGHLWHPAASNCINYIKFINFKYNYNYMNLTKCSHSALAICGIQQPVTVVGEKTATWSYNDPVSFNNFLGFSKSMN